MSKLNYIPREFVVRVTDWGKGDCAFAKIDDLPPELKKDDLLAEAVICLGTWPQWEHVATEGAIIVAYLEATGPGSSVGYIATPVRLTKPGKWPPQGKLGEL